jgi:hypothetical protein
VGGQSACSALSAEVLVGRAAEGKGGRSPRDHKAG